MTNPTPEAIEAVARQAALAEGITPGTDQWHDCLAGILLAFIRDAIHRDGGPDADAIRQALGLTWDERGEWIYMDGVDPAARRVVGEWQEVQP